MNRLAIGLTALAFVAVSASSQASNTLSAQSRCNLTEATAPSVSGLRLGMSAQQLFALFPGIAKRTEMKDAVERAKSATGAEAVYLGFDPASDGDARQFRGIESVSAGLYKARVVDFSVLYAAGGSGTVDAWISKVSETIQLPSMQGWVMGPNESPNKVLMCEGILIEAAIQGGSASIRIRNSDYRK